MKFDQDWKQIIKKAWSIRLMILAGALSGAEIILPMFSEAVPKNLFAILSFVAVSSAFVARLVAQKDLGNAE